MPRPAPASSRASTPQGGSSANSGARNGTDSRGSTPRAAPPAFFPRPKAPAPTQNQSEPSPPCGTGQTGGQTCYRLRHIVVERLLNDGSLGLLLHGTSLVGFCSPEAEESGWAIGDQIVEVNGQRVSVFEEFLEKFMAAQDKGLPIDFGVLRREQGEVPSERSSTLEGFFDATDIGDLAGRLQRKFGVSTPGRSGQRTPTPCSSMAWREGLHLPREDSVTENPYIQALRRRRAELSGPGDMWACETERQPLAAKLATRRSDALASLQQRPAQKPPAPPLALAACMAGGGPQCGTQGCSNNYTVQPTPRVDLDTDVLAWAVPDGFHKERPELLLKS